MENNSISKVFTFIFLGMLFSLPTLAQVTKSLVCHFPLDWSLKCTTSDLISVVPKGDVKFLDGKIGAGISFGSDSSEGQLIIDPILPPNWEEFSVSLWLKANPNQPPPFVLKDLIAARYDDLLVSYRLTQSRHSSPDSVALVFSIKDYSNEERISVTAIVDSSWNHITCTAKTEDSIAIYVNGNKKAVISNPLKKFFYVNEFLLGNDEEVYACPVGSILDDVKVYRRQLLEEETRKLASSGVIKPNLKSTKVFPNPVKRGQLLTVDFPYVREYSIKLFSPIGEHVSTWLHHQDSQLFLDLSDYPLGIYTLSIFDSEETILFSKSIVLVD